MSDDGNLRPLFRSNLSTFFWMSIEPIPSEKGAADSYYCKGGKNGFIEFKVATANKIKSLKVEQVTWHMKLSRFGGRSLFAVRRKNELLLVKGHEAAVLKEFGLDHCLSLKAFKRPWPWEEIGQKLLNE